MEYDVFISHASEDKETFVKDLAVNLQEKGLSVWYDDFTLRLGDSLSESISKGIAGSSYGIVVISPYFIAKKWTKRELAALVAREDYTDKVILPIWHGISKQDLLDHLPLLADKLAINSKCGVEAVALKIMEVVSPNKIANKKYQQGLDYEREGDIDKALTSYIDALRIDRSHTFSLTKIVDILNSQRSSFQSENSEEKYRYKIKLNALQARYRTELKAKNEQIGSYLEHNASLENIIDILATKRIQMVNNVTAQAQSESISESSQSKYDQRNSNNQFIDLAQSGSNPTFNQHNYTSQQRRTLAQAAAEIQQLLSQLAQSNPTTEQVTAAVHQEIKHNPTFKARLLGALEAGVLEALKTTVNHPLFSIPAETIKGWLEAE